MKIIILSFFIIALLVCPILDVQATNYNESISENIPSNEWTSSQQQSIIDEKNKQISELQFTEKLSLSVALVFGGVAIYSEIQRRKNDKTLKDFISNETCNVLDSINNKKDEKQTPAVNGSRNFDFSKFLLECTQRFFLKTSDIAGLLISIISIFVAIVATIISLQLQLWIALSLIGLDAFGLIVIPYVIQKDRLKKNNEKIFKIEKIIIKNYECINKRDDEVKDSILEEFNRVLREKDHDSARLIEFLSKPCKD